MESRRHLVERMRRARQTRRHGPLPPLTEAQRRLYAKLRRVVDRTTALAAVKAGA